MISGGIKVNLLKFAEMKQNLEAIPKKRLESYLVPGQTAMMKVLCKNVFAKSFQLEIIGKAPP